MCQRQLKAVQEDGAGCIAHSQPPQMADYATDPARVRAWAGEGAGGPGGGGGVTWCSTGSECHASAHVEQGSVCGRCECDCFRNGSFHSPRYRYQCREGANSFLADYGYYARLLWLDQQLQSPHTIAAAGAEVAIPSHLKTRQHAQQLHFELPQLSAPYQQLVPQHVPA